MVSENLVPAEGTPAALSDDYVEVEWQPTDDAPAEPLPEQETPPDDEDQYFIRIDKRSLNDEQINTLIREHTEFKEAFNRNVGRRAAERYQPRLQALQSEIETLRGQQKAAEYRALPREEVERRISDPATGDAFKADYIKHVDYKPPEQPQLNPMQESLRILIEDAVDNGLTEEDLAVFSQRMQTSQYYTDEAGVQLTESEWPLAVRKMKRDIDSMVAARRAPAPVAPTNNPPPAANNGDSGGPVMNNPGNRGNQTAQFTWEQFKAMNPEQREKLWPTEADEERAFLTGQIEMPDDLKI